MPGSGNVGLCLVGIVIEADLITLPHELFEIADDIEDFLLPEWRGLRFADVTLDEVLNVPAHSVFEAGLARRRLGWRWFIVVVFRPVILEQQVVEVGDAVFGGLHG